MRVTKRQLRRIIRERAGSHGQLTGEQESALWASLDAAIDQLHHQTGYSMDPKDVLSALMKSVNDWGDEYLYEQDTYEPEGI